MALSWNEIKERAVKFSNEWADTTNEEADAKPFLVEFFNVFGISNKRVATFEHRVKKLDEKDGYIDLLWKGMILIEMKSRGKNLDKAYGQAKDYVHGLKNHELPKYILVCDFEHFRLYDLEENNTIEFVLHDLVHNVQHFAYLVGYQKRVYKEQDPANIKAAELMGKLHDRLEEIGYTGHPLEVYLVRLLFCLFAEDTTIFSKQQFQDYIEQRTNEDGSDLAARLQELFQVLNTPNDKRFKNLDEQLADFPYVNGKLFEENLPTASFDSKMRTSLLNCCYLDWSKISPAIFGSMFQSVMNPQERRNLGAHYTSEKNILKLITPLFLDELRQEFNDIVQGTSKGAARTKKLTEFHKKIRSLTFLDPACGCGNFLVITYRELRLLELDILRVLHTSGQGVLDVKDIIWVDVDQFYGIEYEEFPARIAEVAMWLIDHQMNMMVSNEFGQYYVRLPLKKSATIVHGNALQLDWRNLIKKQPIELEAKDTTVVLSEPFIEYTTVSIRTENLTIIDKREGKPKPITVSKCFDYIIGNPPFVGERYQNEIQRRELECVFGEKVKLDYVSGWYVKAAQYIQNTKIKVAFVSTNSICQGEQTSILWSKLFNRYKVKIHFAHQTFKWNNEARGVAAVYCVIVGFANYDTTKKSIYEYANVKDEPHEIKAKNISPYLVDSKDVFIIKRSKPICEVPIMQNGSRANDKGHLLFTEDGMLDFILKEPLSKKYFRKVVGANEFIRKINRYCLWLEDANPSDLRSMKNVLTIISKISTIRTESPHLFESIRKT